MRRMKRQLAEKAENRIARLTTFEDARHATSRKLEKDSLSRRERQLKLQRELSVAAFDGLVDEVRRLIKAGADVRKKDEEGNYALGEAAVNGQTDTVVLLLSLGADPNSRGVYDRTPIWRATFNNHTDTVKALLEGGGDPRLLAQSESALDLGRDDVKTTVYAKWDMAKTDSKVKAFNERRSAQDAADQAKLEAVIKAENDVVGEAKKKLQVGHKELLHAKQELERRILEYDLVSRGAVTPVAPDLVDIALQCLKEQELKVTMQEEKHAALTLAYVDAMTMRSAKIEAETAGSGHTGHNGGAVSEGGLIPAIDVPFGAIADVVLRDSRRLFQQKWPLLLDPTDRVGTFLRHRDVNYVDAFRPNHLSPPLLRVSLLGSLRHGKPLVIDLHDVPTLEAVCASFETIQKGLWSKVLDRSIRDKAAFMTLVREDEDGEQYSATKFSSQMLEAWMFVIVTSALYVDDETLANVVTIRVVDGGALGSD